MIRVQERIVRLREALDSLQADAAPGPHWDEDELSTELSNLIIGEKISGGAELWEHLEHCGSCASLLVELFDEHEELEIACERRWNQRQVQEIGHRIQQEREAQRLRATGSSDRPASSARDAPFEFAKRGARDSLALGGKAEVWLASSELSVYVGILTDSDLSNQRLKVVYKDFSAQREFSLEAVDDARSLFLIEELTHTGMHWFHVTESSEAIVDSAFTDPGWSVRGAGFSMDLDNDFDTQRAARGGFDDWQDVLDAARGKQWKDFVDSIVRLPSVLDDEVRLNLQYRLMYFLKSNAAETIGARQQVLYPRNLARLCEVSWLSTDVREAIEAYANP